MKHTISKLISKERLKLFVTGKTMSFGVGYVAFLGGRLLRDLLLARILGAGSFGAWAALNILRQYGNYSDAGLMNGLARELPKIKDDKAQASELSGLAVFGTIIGTALVLLWVLLIKPEGFKTDDISWIALSLMILFICFEKSYKYFNALLLGFDQVKAAGLWLACLSILDLILAITGAYFWGVEGLLSGTVLAIFITAVAMNYNKPVSIKFKYSFVTLKNLLLSSILLMCFGLLNIALHNFDRTVFLFLNGPDEILGSYHAASLFALAVSIVPFILCTVVNPYIYSLKSDSDSEFIRIVNSTGLISCIVACVGALLAFFISPYILELFFPLQKHAVNIVPYLILGELFFAASMIFDSILLVKNRGVHLLVGKFITLVVVMGSATFYFYSYSSSRSADLAVNLAKSMSLAQVGCFVVSFLLCYDVYKATKIKRSLFKILPWPLLLALTAFVIIYFSKVNMLWKI